MNQLSIETHRPCRHEHRLRPISVSTQSIEFGARPRHSVTSKGLTLDQKTSIARSRNHGQLVGSNDVTVGTHHSLRNWENRRQLVIHAHSIVGRVPRLSHTTRIHTQIINERAVLAWLYRTARRHRTTRI